MKNNQIYVEDDVLWPDLVPTMLLHLSLNPEFYNQ